MNILRYSHFGIAGGQEVDHTFVIFVIHNDGKNQEITLTGLQITKIHERSQNFVKSFQDILRKSQEESW